MKELLLTPGPTMIPSEVQEAMNNANIHHRTPAFEAIFSETLDAYADFVQSPTRPIALAGTGTAAMDATLQNICSRGDTIIVLDAGKFSERWLEIAAVQGLKTKVVRADWGSTFSLEDIENALRDTPEATALCCQYCETSTTALHDVKSIGTLLQRLAPEMLFVVDAITAVGVKEVQQCDSAIDILICGSQKALMLPPGLALLSLSTQAWEKIEAKNNAVFYFNLLKERIAHAKNTTAYTPAISLIVGLNAALRRIRKEGYSAVYARHAAHAELTRSTLKSLGFSLLAENCPAPGVTGGFPPDGIDADALRSTLASAHSIRVAGGQGEFKSKIIRFGHMGATTEAHVRTGLSAITQIIEDSVIRV